MTNTLDLQPEDMSRYLQVRREKESQLPEPDKLVVQRFARFGIELPIQEVEKVQRLENEIGTCGDETDHPAYHTFCRSNSFNLPTQRRKSA
mgnify:CR=1 FL=1